MEEILERQLLTRGRAFATFSTIEKALGGRKQSFRGPHAAGGPCVVQACCKGSSAMEIRAASASAKLSSYVNQTEQAN